MKKIHNLSLSGGGVYGFAHVGALVELEKYSDIIDIKNISAVSCGSIIAALYSVGYTAEELHNLFLELDLNKLICTSSSCKLSNLYKKFGMYDATNLEEEIDKLISIKTNIKHCTFNQIEKNLTIVATNLNYQKAAYFNKENTPLMPISKAVRISISYPGIIVPIEYENNLYGDGGEFSNYPITFFKNLDETIGIVFVTQNENIDGTLKNRNEIKSVCDYMRAVFYTMSRAAYISQITSEHFKRSIIVNIPDNIDSMQFNLNLEQQMLLYEAGKKAAIEQINTIIKN